MKTAMQELIEHLDIEMKQKGIIPNWDMYLEKEKEQIKRAFKFGVADAYNFIEDDAEQYFNQTYNN